MMKQTTTMLALAAACSAASASSEAQVHPGKQVFDQWCAACHAAGDRMPGTASLAAKYGNSMPAALEQRDNLNPALVRYFVRNGILTMPPFRKTEITDAELDALGAYLSRTPAR
jgi:mono/diheme cytochrome c family protein